MQQLSNVAFLTASSVQCSTILNAKFSQELELVLFSSRTETVFWRWRASTLWCFAMLNSHRRTRNDKTVLSVSGLVCRCESNNCH